MKSPTYSAKPKCPYSYGASNKLGDSTTPSPSSPAAGGGQNLAAFNESCPPYVAKAAPLNFLEKGFAFF